ncbi:MAG: thioredoxin domain-containing protein [Magnetospirillum sp.]|nr:thioredoxin domain-containing protein [Magnetospirillum sp.]
MAANLLAQETSPYLLQHKDNPVAWRPWGTQALAEAKAANKPILLSVGYAACHWCHVMAHESFEDPATAGLMNELFVPIKVDREERPDLDALYQQALTMMGQQGGWPLTMFLTPAGEPFWGGTYFPPTSRWGRPGFPDVLHSVAATWKTEPDRVGQNVAAMRAGLEAEARAPGAGELSQEMLDRCAGQVLRLLDPEHGGLMGAPKFPQPGLFQFLWKAGWRSGDERLREAVTLTLDHICFGGICDHLGGGFMRYSTDEAWLAPHFEKMLYDNAQLIELLTLVWKGTRNPLYRARVAEAAEWVLREMIAEDGAFAATLDADSEGEEGRFYTWTAEEIATHLDEDAARYFCQAYDVRPGGNWEGRTILHRNHPNQPVGVDEMLADARAVLWRVREARVRPDRDDKVLADWNGMMITALAGAGFTFAMPRWIDAARTAFEAVRRRMSLPHDRLAHSMRFGRRGSASVIDDYAQMIRAALALAEVTGEAGLVEQAAAWAAAARRHHWDGASGGWFLSADDAADVVVRGKPAFDGATPSGNGAMAEALARLWLATGAAGWRDLADATVAAFSAAASEQFASMTALLGAFELVSRPTQVVVVGPPGATADALLQAVAEAPATTLSLIRAGDGTALPERHPAHGKDMVERRPTAYVCHAFTCSAPIVDATRLQEALSSG